MAIQLSNPRLNIDAGDFRFTFLNSGDLFEATYKDIMLNQWMSNPIDGSLNNLFLRVHDEAGIKAYPLLGVKSESTVTYTSNSVKWVGEAAEVAYSVVFRLSDKGIWFWDITVDGQGQTVDLVYGQDVGLGSKGFVRTNESYLSQYIDHTVFEDTEKGYVLCSRQNQPQPGGFSYLQQGSLTKSIGYSTDGFQFFGLSYKETNEPEVLTKESLANEIYQYEFAFTALQSEKVALTGEKNFVFYGLFKENHETAVTELEFTEDIAQAWQEVKAVENSVFEKLENVQISNSINGTLSGASLTKEELDSYFPIRHQEEWEGDTLLSFFTDTHEHIVLKEKELVVERPHGHIIMTGNNDKMTENILTSTSYMYGIFNSQLVVGNTSFHKMMTNARNALNVMKTSGQRIYVEVEGTYKLLTMPSVFEIGFNYTRWYYKTANDVIVVTNFSVVDSPEIQLEVRSEQGTSYRYLVTNQISMNNNELDVSFDMKQDGKVLTFSAVEGSDSKHVYPDLSYKLTVDGTDFHVADETKLAKGVVPGSASLVVLELEAAANWNMTLQGLLHGEERELVTHKFEEEVVRYRAFFEKVMNGFKLSLGSETKEELEKMNALAWWYTHNMLVHYSVPHGLEQYGGAAWGTRDVCQGPTEYFMATQNYDSVKEIIKKVYSHQYEDTGNWPQWFMFDKYFHIQSEESHGDIIVWPLKVLGDYLTITKDYSILEEKIPYTVRGAFHFTETTATVLEHAKKEIQFIKDHFLHDTFLSSYGDGDWDDTLQPANAQLKQYMVSSWTVSLTYQVLNTLSKALEDVSVKEAEELGALVKGIEIDFNKYMLSSNVIPGFVYMEKQDKPELMVHPQDTKTGIHYRLLPMTRSMISELLTPEQAESHYQLIKEQLFCPDGVRLMNRPANYAGGVSTHFKRAEQAANFGREIGLQYVHAHIRYVEAMAKLGKTDEVWNGLNIINPINIQQVVPNAERRQSNAYFSSSDGLFNNRYEAQEQFGKLRDGSVKVKGGWRIYSSGPGIYMNQLISNCLGIRFQGGDLVVDPVLPADMDGLHFTYKVNGLDVTFIYRLKNDQKKVQINGQEVDGNDISNRYRSGGLVISKEVLEQHLISDKNEIKIYI
ncbi:GH36-type glycosyl hydrolase domain-containing protein [Sutcliffiella rhizosphaerae]|uniref:1,2-beta-oligoglucan phosphorylase n=1 Tax=Sutcliffiella rhizosphaerae TaxID=2880967 RepID=A0ABN8A6R9_9BACI|nr:cellobiose phosphorylase [Sutcliffiella rhizosphaerae]CAG9620791.1 1,2-beta-oligoglucan phosphorylase [Sutcliffiella rhizosphaerae]